MKKQMYGIALTLVVCSSTMHAMEIKDGTAEINYRAHTLTEPMQPVTVGALSAAGGALVGAFIGASLAEGQRNPEKTIGVTTLVCAALSALYFLWQNNLYRAVHATSEGLDMHGAAAQDNKEGVAALAEYGYSVIAQDRQGKTPLMYAAATGAQNTAQEIMDRSPEHATVIDSVGKSIARKPGYFDRHNRWVPEQRTETDIENSKVINPINLQDKSKMTAATHAAICNQPEVLTMLLRAGADGSLADNFGDTVGSIAMRNPEIAKAQEEARRSRK